MDEVHKWTDDQLEKLEKKIAKTYKQAEKELKEKAEKYLETYAVNLEKKKADLKAGTITKEEFESWKRSVNNTIQSNAEMIDTISNDLLNVDRIAADIINDTTPGIYAENFNFATYQIEKGVNISTSFTLYDKDTVYRLLTTNASLLPKARVDIPKDLRWNKQHISSAITQGILQGESIPKISQRLITVTGMNKNSAIRNARTATTGAENAGRIQSYERAKNMGIELKKEWIATLDGRTRHSHRQLDGVIIDTEDEFLPGLKYPGDPHGQPWEVYNCRCTLVASFPDIKDYDYRKNASIGDKSYKEWKNGKKANKNKRSDGAR